MEYFHAKESDWVIVTFQLCWIFPESTASHILSVAMPAFVVTMGLVREVSSFCLCLFLCFYFYENFSYVGSYCAKATNALESLGIKLLYLKTSNHSKELGIATTLVFT